MINIICLDERYSTTKLLTQDKPEIVNNPEDKFKSVLFLPEAERRKGEGGLRTQGYFKKSFEDKPLISIITVVYNGEEFLEETINSVINQTYDNVEYIIIDGGSIDGTINIVKKYEEQIDCWVSEKDDGISDAFNKGINKCSGDYILMLNAGDVFANYSIMQENIEKFKDNDLIIFHTYVKNTTYMIGIDTLKNKSSREQARLPHQGTFVHKNIYVKYGLYDKNYKIRMDYDFFLRFVGKCNVIFINKVLVYYDNSGISSQIKYRYRYEQEAIISEYKHLKQNPIYLLKLLYKPLLMTILSWIKNNLFFKNRNKNDN